MQDWRKPKLSVSLWIAAVTWCGVLFFFSGQSGTESHASSLLFARFVLRHFPSIPYPAEALEPILRKCAHFGIFAVEGALLSGALMTCLRERFAGGMLAALSCAVIATLNEFHQSFSVGRSCELRDVLIDSCGGIAGVLLGVATLWIAFALASRLRGRRKML